MLEQQIRQMPGFEDVSSDLQLNNPQVTVEMDRDKLSSLGLTATQVETALYNAYGTRQVSQIYAPNNQYRSFCAWRPSFRTIRPRCRCSTSVEHRAAHSARVGRADEDRGGPAPGEPLRPAAVGDDLVQPGPGFALGMPSPQIEALRHRRFPMRSRCSSRARRRRFQTRCAGWAWCC